MVRVDQASEMTSWLWVSSKFFQEVATRYSSRATLRTSRAASAFIAAMPSPTIRSGHPGSVEAVTNPAAMIATFARASFRADRNAARVRLPLCARKCTSMNAHDRFEKPDAFLLDDLHQT